MAVWFRSWHGAPTDNKWLVVARRSKTTPGVVSAIFWALLDCASQASDRGDISEFDIETYAEFSGFGDDVVAAVVNVMREKNVIIGNRLANWDKRQPKREDDSTERVRRHRAEKNATVDSNALKRNVTHGNNTEKETDTDTEKETRRDEKLSDVSPSLSPSLATEVAALLNSIGLEPTTNRVKRYTDAVAEYGFDTVSAGLTAASDMGKESEWRYVMGCIRNKAQSPNGKAHTGAPNGAGAIDITGSVSPEIVKALR